MALERTRFVAPVALPKSMSPSQKQGWLILLDLAKAFPTGWCLVGGQMVWLLAAEHGAAPPRATDDVDLVVDIRAEPAGIRDLCRWLGDRGFNLEGISPEGIGHRYVRQADPGQGEIKVDVLAPDNVGERADLSTTHGARTVEAAGSRSTEQLGASRSLGRRHDRLGFPPDTDCGDHTEGHRNHGPDPDGN